MTIVNLLGPGRFLYFLAWNYFYENRYQFYLHNIAYTEIRKFCCFSQFRVLNFDFMSTICYVKEAALILHEDLPPSKRLFQNSNSWKVLEKLRRTSSRYHFPRNKLK